MTALSHPRGGKPAHALRRARFGAPLLLVLFVGCGDPPPPESPPVELQNPVLESDLTVVKLSPEAEQRIGIQVARVESQSLVRRRLLGGELVSPPGAAVSVTAPRAATVLGPVGGVPPVAGARVARGEPLLRLMVLMDAGELARTREQLDLAVARFENAQSKEARAQQLLRDSVGTAAELEDARAELSSAEAVLRAARARMEQMGSGVTPENSAGLSAVTLTAPESGIVTGVHFAVGQTVSDGALLLEIVRPDPLWVRVPVYVGDVSGISRQASATVVAPGEPAETAGRTATPIQGPPTANAASASADLFYRLSNPDGRFRPGERVGVVLEFGAATQAAPIVPWSAVMHDIYGGTWVYESLGNHQYARRRVEVREVSGGMATLRRGIAVGTSVVIVGAAELYSSEFGTTH